MPLATQELGLLRQVQKQPIIGIAQQRPPKRERGREAIRGSFSPKPLFHSRPLLPVTAGRRKGTTPRRQCKPVTFRKRTTRPSPPIPRLPIPLWHRAWPTFISNRSNLNAAVYGPLPGLKACLRIRRNACGLPLLMQISRRIKRSQRARQKLSRIQRQRSLRSQTICKIFLLNEPIRSLTRLTTNGDL
jgi:hypothetical protein